MPNIVLCPRIEQRNCTVIIDLCGVYTSLSDTIDLCCMRVFCVCVDVCVANSQSLGYQEMIESLHDDLAKITGFAACSGQPNSGAQVCVCVFEPDGAPMARRIIRQLRGGRLLNNSLRVCVRVEHM